MSTTPQRGDRPSAIGEVTTLPRWNVVVWNDPVNLASYVVWVFCKLFGHDETRATELMLDIHHRGRAVVASEPRERAELDVARLHQHGLGATLERG